MGESSHRYSERVDSHLSKSFKHFQRIKTFMLYIFHIFNHVIFQISKLHSAESCPDISHRCNGCPLCQRPLSFAYVALSARFAHRKLANHVCVNLPCLTSACMLVSCGICTHLATLFHVAMWQIIKSTNSCSTHPFSTLTTWS
jgi:hypothetical protein